MRILAVHNRYKRPGGEDLAFEAELSLLRQNGHELMEWREDNRDVDHMSRLYTAAQTIWSLSAQRRIREILNNFQCDVVSFHNTFLLISPAIYSTCQDIGVPVVQTLHNYRLLCPAATFYRQKQVCEDCLGKTFPWPGVIHGCWRQSYSQTAVVAGMLTFHRWLRTWQDKVDIYIALTEFARKKFVEGGLPPEKIVVKPNFVYPDPGQREGSGTYALFVGRLSEEKGLRTLLDAWRSLNGIPLKIVGSGPLQDQIQTFVHTYNLDEVEILGQKTSSEVLALMQGARFLVFPSEWYEGLPLTLLEAFACGVPVLAARLGAMEEIIEEERTGLLFTPGDAENLAAHVERIWRHSSKIGEMGRAARAEFERKYTASLNYETLMTIFQRAIEKHRS